MAGRTIQQYLIDDDPQGRIKCSILHRSCVAYKLNYDDLALCSDIKELSHSGIYFLFGGIDDKSSKEVVYVGQAGVRNNDVGILNRIKEQKRDFSKNYWKEVVAFTTDSNKLGRTEICYLENYFFNLAKQAGRYIVKNGNTPNDGNISEEQKSALEDFVDNVKLITGALGYKIFVPLIDTYKNDNTTFYFRREIQKTGITVSASGQKTREGFVVFKGARISQCELKDIPKRIKQLRENAKISKKGILRENMLFSSPSYAAAFVVGGHVNGRTGWKTKDGVALTNFYD